MAILRSVGARKQLEVQIAGKSLFNGGIGVVIFVVLLEISGISTSPATTIPSHPVGFGDVTMHLLKEVGGALILGLAAGMLVDQMLKRLDNYQVEVLLTLDPTMGGLPTVHQDLPRSPAGPDQSQGLCCMCLSALLGHLTSYVSLSGCIPETGPHSSCCADHRT